MVGFRDAGYFSKLFRQTFGYPPSEHLAVKARKAENDSPIDQEQSDPSEALDQAAPSDPEETEDEPSP